MLKLKDNFFDNHVIDLDTKFNTLFELVWWNNLNDILFNQIVGSLFLVESTIGHPTESQRNIVINVVFSILSCSRLTLEWIDSIMFSWIISLIFKVVGFICKSIEWQESESPVNWVCRISSSNIRMEPIIWLRIVCTKLCTSHLMHGLKGLIALANWMHSLSIFGARVGSLTRSPTYTRKYKQILFHEKK